MFRCIRIIFSESYNSILLQLQKSFVDLDNKPYKIHGTSFKIHKFLTAVRFLKALQIDNAVIYVKFTSNDLY